MTSGKQKIIWAGIAILVLIYALFPVASILSTALKAPSDLTSGNILHSSGAGT